MLVERVAISTITYTIYILGAGNSVTLGPNVKKGSEPDPSLDPEQSLQSGGFKIPDVPKPSSEEIKDWAGEVRMDFLFLIFPGTS